MTNHRDLTDRSQRLARLVGIQSSKLNYYPEFKQQLAELEYKNELLQQAKETTDALYERSRRQAERLDRAIVSLSSISGTLTTTTEGVDVLLQKIMRTITNVFDTSLVLLISDGPDKEQRVMAQPMAAQLRDNLLKRLEDVTPQMTTTFQPVQLNNIRGEPLHELRSDFMCVPMQREGILVGTICLRINRDRGLDDYDLATLQILANQAAVALQNAQLFAESRRLQAKAEAMYHLARQEQEKAKAAQAEINTMERQQIISTERERLARDLHDSVAQILTSIGINLEWCRQHLPPKSPLTDRFTLLKWLARNGLYEIRRAILKFSATRVAEIGLALAVETLVGDFEKIAGISASFELKGEVCQPDHQIEDALYHICQEALYNVFKHAQASQVRVTLTFTPADLALRVTDDGIGIDPGIVNQIGQNGATFGLTSMTKRTTELQGTLSINNVNGSGTEVVAHIPA